MYATIGKRGHYTVEVCSLPARQCRLGMDGKSIYRPLAAHTRAPDSSALPSHLGYSCVAAIHLANSSFPLQSSVGPTAIHHKLPRVSCYCCSPQLDSLAPPAALDSHAYRRTPRRFVMFLKPTTRTPTFSCSVSKDVSPTNENAFQRLL